MSKDYQKRVACASPGGSVPEEVTIGLAEIAASAKEGLLALAVSTGLQVMEAMFAEDVRRLCGLKSKHNPGRAGYRHGHEQGTVTLGGRRLPVTRPRVRSTDGAEELPLPGLRALQLHRGPRSAGLGEDALRALPSPLRERS